jgi:heterodisulfide reductase subunit A
MSEENKKLTTPQGKVGVYICHCGGNISDHVDVEKLAESAKKNSGVVVSRTNMFMCSDPGQEMIMEDLKNGKVDRVVVASCSPSLHEATFRNAVSRAGANPYIYEHANIREQASWVHHGKSATAKASHLVSAAVAKAELLEPLEPIRMEAMRHATVIGGGVAGLRAVIDLADSGIPVTLIEKSPFLGGRIASLDRIAPTGEKAFNLISELSEQVLRHPAVTVYTCAQVRGAEGYVGDFNLRVKRKPPETIEIQDALNRIKESNPGTFVPFKGIYPGSIPQEDEDFFIATGVIIVATGFKPYSPSNGEYGYGEYHQIVTLPDFVETLAENDTPGDVMEIDGRKIRSVGMIHCVGSRQIPGIHAGDESGNLNEYCSRTCCSATLNAANTIRERYPKTLVYEFYRDIRTYGRGQEALYEQAAKNRVVFLRFNAEDSPKIIQNEGTEGYPLQIHVKDTLTFGEEVEVPVDLVVLATGMEPNDVSHIIDMMKLPVGPDRFLLEVHPKLRPVEVSVAGIFLAGTCQAPMDVGEACSAASSAAVKASALLSRGHVELDPFVAEVALDKCTGTGACVEACLCEGALEMVETEMNGEWVQRAQVKPALCSGCGACVAVCPENAINVKGWTLKQYEAMVDRIVSDAVNV